MYPHKVKVPPKLDNNGMVYSNLEYTGQFKKKVTLSHVYNEVTSEPTITRHTTIVRKTLKSLFVIDVGKCFGPPPGETVLQNGDSTAKSVLYPAVWKGQLCNNCATAVPHVSELIH
jgi:hypothetical protein